MYTLRNNGVFRPSINWVNAFNSMYYTHTKHKLFEKAIENLF
jgi:hypothetical protein